MSPPPSATTPKLALFIVYVAVVLTVMMILFPPFTSLSGTEYAFALTGPEWARAMGDVGAELGLSARLYWPLLLGQLAALWAIALGASRWLLRLPSPLRNVW